MDKAERDRIEGVIREFLKREGVISDDHTIDHHWIRQEMANRKAKEERDSRIAATLTGGVILGLLGWVGHLVIQWLRGGHP